MFEEFCTALMLELVHMKHGRKFTLDVCMESYTGALIEEFITSVLHVEIPPNQVN